MNPRITLLIAALTGAIFLSSAPAEARRHAATQYGSAPMIDAAAVPAYPYEARKAPRARGRAVSRRRAVTLASLSPSEIARPLPEAPAAVSPTLKGYEAAPAPIPAGAAARGLVTISVAGGHRITVSQDFAGPISGLIADLYAHGYSYGLIKCWAASRGHHVSGSNHFSGDACDFLKGRRNPPAAMARAHGLRSGRDFADSMHVDNARNVGGVAFWNHVKHGGPRATRLASGHRYHRRVRIARR